MPETTPTAGTPLPAPPGDTDPQLRELAEVLADETRAYLAAMQQVAGRVADELDIPLVLLALAGAQAAGARLGAHVDIVPADTFEEDTGPDADLDRLREALAVAFEGVDEYICVVDTLVDPTRFTGRVSDDLVSIAQALTHGLRHYEAGRTTEALWWWQYSYLSGWGDSAASAMRTVVAILAHERLDIDDETASEAEFEALHRFDAPR